LRWAKLGQYTRISKAFFDLANSELNLETCSVEELEQISGIGPKTARFFKLHTDLLAKCAALDTHVLKFLRGGGVENVPDITPSSKKEYLRLELEFLKLFHKQNLYESLADYDLAIWRRFSA
jgi:thermostable 8-oxoguanine DNA glycosylase